MNIRNSKFTPSPLPEIYAPRNKLLTRIEQAAETGLVYLCAPAGSGKTVTALLWMQASGRTPIWIGLDSFDNSIAVFYKMFATGILAAQPDNARMEAILHSQSFSASPVEHTINLLTEFIADDTKYALAIDDYHTITNNEIKKSLPYILRRMPRNVVTLILSRNEHREYPGEPDANGSAAVIGTPELAFTADEVIEYYSRLGIDITHREAETALSKTGGWAIGINALAQSKSTGSNATLSALISAQTSEAETNSAAPGALTKPAAAGMPATTDAHAATGSPVITGLDIANTLNDYIEKHIWVQWDESLRAFILTSAVLDVMPTDLCSKITSRRDAGEILEKLMEQNAFVTRIEDNVYRYHHLFLDFLRNLNKSMPAEQQNSRIKHLCIAAKYYLDKGEPLIARRYAIESGDVSVIAEVQYAFAVNRGHSIDDYVNVARSLLLSDSVRELCEKCPVLYIACAYCCWLTGEAKAFEHNIDLLRQNLPKIILKYPSFVETTYSMFALDYRTPFAKLIRQSRLMPMFRFKGDEMRSASVTMQMPFLHRSTRDYFELTDKKLYGDLRKTYGRLLRDHYELIMKALSAGLYLEQNRTSEALNDVRAAVSMLTPQTVKEINFSVHMHLAAIYLALGKTRETEEILEKISQYVNEEAMFLRPNLLAFITRVKLWGGGGGSGGSGGGGGGSGGSGGSGGGGGGSGGSGGSGGGNTAREWLDNYFVTESKTLELYRLYQYFTTARAMITLGEYRKAKDLCERLRQMGKEFNRPQDAAEAGVLLSIIYRAEGKSADAAEMLRTVLEELQPHGFIRLIADEGAAVAPILKKILGRLRRKTSDSYEPPQPQLNPVYVNSVYIAANITGKQRKGILTDIAATSVKLSKQQNKILGLYAQGYKREDLQDLTGLSINTIKTHTQALYEKLGVSNAADAVAKAKLLNIL